jgi:hypothetical protein
MRIKFLLTKKHIAEIFGPLALRWVGRRLIRRAGDTRKNSQQCSGSDQGGHKAFHGGNPQLRRRNSRSGVIVRWRITTKRQTKNSEVAKKLSLKTQQCFCD